MKLQRIAMMFLIFILGLACGVAWSLGQERQRQLLDFEAYKRAAIDSAVPEEQEEKL